MMKRKFEPFDEKVIRKEFFELPEDDATYLRIAMGKYQNDMGAGYTVKNYGDGLFMLKSASGAAGRCLFFHRAVVAGIEVLTVVLIYKKESREAPARIVETARRRMEAR